MRCCCRDWDGAPPLPSPSLTMAHGRRAWDGACTVPRPVRVWQRPLLVELLEVRHGAEDMEEDVLGGASSGVELGLRGRQAGAGGDRQAGGERACAEPRPRLPARTVTPQMRPHSLTKYSRSPSPHLFVSCARRARSDANCSSRSNRSSAGGGGSLKAGGKTAGCSGGSGVSNCGGMSDSGSCFTPSASKSDTASGMARVSNLKSASSKSRMKSAGSGSLSCRQDRSRSERDCVSGR